MDCVELVRKFRHEYMHAKNHGIDCWADGYLLAAKSIEELLNKSNKENKDEDSFLDNVRHFVAYCTNSTDLDDVEKRLLNVISKCREELKNENCNKELEYIKCIEKISRGLHINAEDNDALRYYYFGKFQAYVEQLKQINNKNQQDRMIKDVVSQDYFEPIMRYLYKNGYCCESCFYDNLKIDRSTLLDAIDKLERINFVKLICSVEGVYLVLTPKGREYWDGNLLSKI